MPHETTAKIIYIVFQSVDEKVLVSRGAIKYFYGGSDHRRVETSKFPVSHMKFQFIARFISNLQLARLPL